MKQIHLYSLVALFSVIFTGCQKDFLDRTPETNISDADYWKTSNDLKLYANNFYNNLLPNYNGWGSIGIYGLDADGSDNMIYVTYNSAMNGERVIPGSGGGYGAYDDWSMLRNMNYFMANYTKVTEPFDNVKTYVGEALFFRAYFYFSKLKSFGDLPWVSKPLETSSPEVYNERLPRNQIVDSILQDLDLAVSYLPTKAQAQPSRITKEIAMLFLSRIALFEGTWEKYHRGTVFGVSGSDGRKYLEKAAAVSGALLTTSGGYGLHDLGDDPYGYWKLFNKVDYTGNNEIMLWRAFNINLGLGHRWHRYTNTGAGRGLSKDLVDAYLCKDGLPIGVSSLYKGDATLQDVVTDRDPRLRQTMYVNDGEHVVTNNRPNGLAPALFMYPTFEVANENKSITGYQVYKGHNPDYNQQQDQGTTGQIIFRFAEGLLIYAEARAELGLLSQDDLDKTVNLFRKRVGMPKLMLGAVTADPNQEFKDLSPILNEIRRERRVELAAEGYRADDLYRWAAMDEKIIGKRQKGAKRQQWEVPGVPENTAKAAKNLPIDDKGYIDFYQNVGGLKNGFQFNKDRDYLSPIPVDQLTLNPKIKQNPGWK
ncbi:RagB/SusD family nutrient uptake outer membrane protein [Sphingobacterium psychroaquaticum]|uniref:Starch-binding associating with outer membrane n=1 Tax=Sphingobacterium psychroaquaticum TaxID=561061 RepID=A0A1X7J0E4_9SPHI|nr:RagB/SusD family nutrient uptake outer membrane protein [Sphingobacterium psychroaquaticum]SMG21114.1 Starch-binding associating with outer membrane [Sphingobacterium psychroaquaticum]